ncbi:hypothetical protein [Allocoleopsis franciscana]|uniref:Uncharacterized protein n=1 Tax=Allocoleopsis franciscana PCC 7113 TaxID=1173027 RepID=K9WB51_9CYAN|nr:hypothetical protein [Allocoleopsis franciscana]AFZ17041.1 hypothetical protein Mic7113_1149 [Allocoleopsis franciscana PCC 7113]
MLQDIVPLIEQLSEEEKILSIRVTALPQTTQSPLNKEPDKQLF